MVEKRSVLMLKDASYHSRRKYIFYSGFVLEHLPYPKKIKNSRFVLANPVLNDQCT